MAIGPSKKAKKGETTIEGRSATDTKTFRNKSKAIAGIEDMDMIALI